MQSSPPTRVWERPGSPSLASDYSLDLGALDPPSGTSTPLPEQHVDRILSEDIDGPSDFTLNMEKWIRGGTQMKKPAVNTIFESQNDQAQEYAIGENGDTGMPEEEVRSASHHTPIHSPQRDRSGVRDFAQGDEQAAHDNEENQPSLDWDPYHSASTPRPQSPVQKHFLQPTVEDYHSELNLPHLPSASRRNPSPTQEQASTPHAQNEVDETLVSERETEGRPSSPTLSPVRSPIVQPSVSHTTPAVKDFDQTDLTHQMQQLQSKCQQVEHLNSALGDALEKERRLRQEDAARHEGEMAEAKRKEHDLGEMKEEAFRHKEEFRSEFGMLEEKVRGLEGANAAGEAAHGSEVKQLKLKHDTEMQAVREQLDREMTEHEQELRAVEQDVELARCSRDDAEEASKGYHEDLAEARREHATAMACFQREAHEAQQSLDKSAQSLQAAIHERDIARADAYEKLQAAAALRTELTTLTQSQQDEMKIIKSDHFRATQLAENLQAQLRQLRQQIRIEQSAHDAELDALRAQQPEPTEIDSLREQLKAAHSRLNSAVIDRDSAIDDRNSLQEQFAEAQLALKNSQTEIEAMKTEHKGVNALLASRIAEAGRQREKFWRSEVEKKEKERVLMARALLRGWGREEVGVTELGNGVGQAYEYRHQYAWRKEGEARASA